MRSFHHPGRSAVYANQAICASSHPFASLAAIEILKKGGNAIDAAVAASAVLAVVEPHMTGIGGDGFALFWKPGEGLQGITGMGYSPEKASFEWYSDRNITSIEPTSAHAVTVPGAIDAWCRLVEDHGKLPLSDIFEAAIHYAEEGYPVSPRTAWDWKRFESKLSIYDETKKRYLIEGRAPVSGETLKCPELARTLRLVAEGGRDAFYTGELAEDMVATLNELGGLHTLEDFSYQKSTYVKPISANYNGYDVYELPPSNHGMTALMMLKMLSRIEDKGSEAVSAKRYHVVMEAARLAYAARDEFLSDPGYMDIPVEHFISDQVADELADRIDTTRRVDNLGPIPLPQSNDTVYLNVVDKDGMAVSFINSIYQAFGSGIVAPKSGVLFHCRGYGFRYRPNHPNTISGRKRPMHTLIPGMVMKDNKPVCVVGVMGADFQPTGQVYVLSNMFDYGMDVQEALDAPRVFFEKDTLSFENSVPKSIISELQSMGHKVSQVTEPWGGGQVIYIDPITGVLSAGSDPRKDGLALGY